MDKLNQDLEQRIQTFKEKQDKKALAEMMECLENCVVIVPATLPKNMTPEIQAAIRAGKNMPVTKDIQPTPCLLKKQDGGDMFPIFSAKEQIPKEKMSPALMNMPFKAVVGMVMANQDKVTEIILNPFTDSLILNKPLVEAADKRFRAMSSKSIKMTEKEFHRFAHLRAAYELLPKYFFGNPKEALAKLKEDGTTMLVNIYQTIYPENVPNPYSEDDFSTMTLQLSDELQITRIDMPDKNRDNGVALRVYITWKNESELGYFTIEKGAEQNQIVQISGDGQKEVKAVAPDNGAEFEAIMELV